MLALFTGHSRPEYSIAAEHVRTASLGDKMVLSYRLCWVSPAALISVGGKAALYCEDSQGCMRRYATADVEDCLISDGKVHIAVKIAEHLNIGEQTLVDIVSEGTYFVGYVAE